jgi:mono/diheme cytochrome c family protein
VLRRGLGVLLALAVGSGSPLAADDARVGEASVARGRYLAHGVGRCFWCHSPLTDSDPATPRPGSVGIGDVLDEKTPIVAGNLTPDGETGLGRWTDAEVARAIREGIGRDGRRLRGDHPARYFSVMTDGDTAAVVAYLRSLAAVTRRLPRSRPQTEWSETVQRPTPPAKEAALSSEAARGAYLAQIGECVGCHTTTTREGAPERALTFGGGRRFRVFKGVGNEISGDASFTAMARASDAEDAGVIASANISPDASGIAFYTREVFIQTIRTGHVAGVRRLSAAMPWAYFRNMTDDDLGAIFTYLRAVPPVRHRVTNFDPPTYCPRCGRRHGLGELNQP